MLSFLVVSDAYSDLPRVVSAYTGDPRGAYGCARSLMREHLSAGYIAFVRVVSPSETTLAIITREGIANV